MRTYKVVSVLKFNHEANVCEACNKIFKVDLFQEGFLRGEKVTSNLVDVYVEYCPFCGVKSRKRNEIPPEGVLPS